MRPVQLTRPMAKAAWRSHPHFTRRASEYLLLLEAAAPMRPSGVHVTASQWDRQRRTEVAVRTQIEQWRAAADVLATGAPTPAGDSAYPVVARMEDVPARRREAVEQLRYPHLAALVARCFADAREAARVWLEEPLLPAPGAEDVQGTGFNHVLPPMSPAGEAAGETIEWARRDVEAAIRGEWANIAERERLADALRAAGGPATYWAAVHRLHAARAADGDLFKHALQGCHTLIHAATAAERAACPERVLADLLGSSHAFTRDLTLRLLVPAKASPRSATGERPRCSRG